jgi:broad specificity phosphatase PhoE
MTFRDKYLKYKIKYLNYLNLNYLNLNYKKSLNQIGSGNVFTSIIVTHNGKLRCLLDKLGFSDDGDYNIRKKKFMNCVILKLEVTSNQMSIVMIDQGDLSKEDNYSMKPYFTSFDKTLNHGLEEAENNKFIFYLIRHGDGYHNKAKIRGINEKIKDPSLTKIGEEQCIRAGKILSAYPQVNFLFVSELVRTRQTLYKILEGGVKFNPINEKFNRVIILPCSRELIYNSKNCDVDDVTTQENEMLCNPAINENPEFCKKLGNFNLDWSYYLDFHGDQIIRRSANCKHTEMVSEAIKIIKN